MGDFHLLQVTSPQSVGSCESLPTSGTEDGRRRSSVGHSQASSSAGIGAALDDTLSDGDLPASPALPNVPPIVLMCIRHLEQHGLRTVGIFRVSSSKKRVRQVRDQLM